MGFMHRTWLKVLTRGRPLAAIAQFALASNSTLLSKSSQSEAATPENICGWWSMKITAQLSGVSSPLSV
jgi:hypothetical protein